MRWKGSITVTQNGRWAGLYIGYGIKTGDVCYNPTIPQEIFGDPNEPLEQPEPTPLTAPAEPEKKEGDGAEAEGEGAAAEEEG